MSTLSTRSRAALETGRTRNAEGRTTALAKPPATPKVLLRVYLLLHRSVTSHPMS